MTNLNFDLVNLTDIFEMSTGANISDNKFNIGNIPRISATAQNNGIQKYTNIINDSKFRTSKNFITVSFLGDSFYHPYFASVDMKIHILKPKNIVLNRYIGLYLATSLNKQMKKYNYGNQLSLSVLEDEQIVLPITDKNTPDFEYIEKYMKFKEQQLIQKYKDYIKNMELTPMREINYDSVKWKECYLNELFEDIQRGKRLTKANFIEGKTPFISSKAESNGIDSFIGNKNKVRIFKDCLTLANSGSVGSTFYHPYEFIASDHVTHLKNQNFNKYIYLFLASIIKRLEQKYNFNREINDNRLKKEIIVLPVNENGAIDYNFIEDYMRNIESNIMQKYLNYITL